MHYQMTIFSLLFLLSCGKEDDTGGVVEDESCASSFTITLADGEVVPFDECKLQAAQVNFAVAPDAIMPQLHRMSFIFRTSDNVSQDCWVLWELDGICAERDTHSFGTVGSTLTFSTLDCDMPDSAKGAFERPREQQSP